ncbi:efflux transporter outer membrane subunit [Undibacterium jejuense]|uniref:Efflux transporter outer membrane subunit n=2 Tax=Undibacterium jejuense TaxID=1344949 RepID=A0A923KNM0_9BURK|nr:efflux transporter outer membrane subunit [Undibacterium jejuense]
MSKKMFRTMCKPKLMVSLLALGLSACAIGPDYVKPKIDTPASFKEDGRWKTAQPMDASPRDAWWEVYQDEQLNNLVKILNEQSPGIAQAEAQYRQTKELLNQAESSLFPQITGNAGAKRGVNAGDAPVTKQYSVGVAASWQIDLWGSVRRAIEAGQAKEEGSVAQLAAIKLSSQAQLVTAYLQLVVADVQLKQLRDSENALKETLTLTSNQFKAGIVSDANVALAESQLKTARAATIDKQLTRAQLEHAIAAALGKPPASFALDVSKSTPHLPQLPSVLPSQLLERRPDIAVAERNMAVSNAQIGIAKAAYFPTISLSASGGYNGNAFSDLISAPNRIWSLGPQLVGNIFDAGATKSKTAQAVAVYDQSVASYKQTVLTAFQNVEDGLVAQSLLEQEERLQNEALLAAQRSELITKNQYAAGTVSYINVLTAQTTRINAEANLWNVRNRQYANSVAFIAAIGGSW